MKIIDLLNKIANDEEVPKRIKFDTQIWRYNPNNDYEGESYGGCLLCELLINQLNDEVEIIEEPQEHKIPEKIDLSDWIEITSIEDTKYKTLERIFNKNCCCFADKINEILDYLQKCGNKNG